MFFMGFGFSQAFAKFENMFFSSGVDFWMIISQHNPLFMPPQALVSRRAI